MELWLQFITTVKTVAPRDSNGGHSHWCSAGILLGIFYSVMQFLWLADMLLKCCWCVDTWG